MQHPAFFVGSNVKFLCLNVKFLRLNHCKLVFWFFNVISMLREGLLKVNYWVYLLRII